MKHWILVLLVPMIAAAAFALFWNGRDARSGARDTGAAAVGVDDFMRHPERHPDQVEVEGVVSTVSSDGGFLTLIDASEYQECGVVNCASLSLPVRWDGEMPSIAERVRVGGHVQESSGKLFLQAQSLRPSTGAREHQP